MVPQTRTSAESWASSAIRLEGSTRESSSLTWAVKDMGYLAPAAAPAVEAKVASGRSRWKRFTR
jgi:hypothetical protein